MNHTSTTLSVAKHLNESRLLSYTGLPYVLGETNSLYNGGAPGLSNMFGAALWAMDFSLYCAATGIGRIHVQLGTNFRYNSWQPIHTGDATKGTKAPYYGNIATTKVLGDLTKGKVRISDIDLGNAHQNAYAVYVNGSLERIAIVQMTEYNYTTLAPRSRPNETFTFQVPRGSGIKTVGVQRLLANGSNAITGITFDGYSYNYELEEGRPVLLHNVTRGEVLPVSQDGVIQVDVPWSSAAVLNLQR